LRTTRCIAGAVVIAAITFAAAPPALAAQGLEGVPGYQHVGVLVLENESFASTWGPGSPATYLRSLVPQGAFASMYYADGHVSLDNYITMTSGQPGNPATYSDCLAQNFFECVQTVNTPVFGNGVNIADQVEAAGLSWKAYEDSMPSPCFHADSSATATPPDPYQGNSAPPPTGNGNYADRHNPFIYYSSIVANPTRCQADVVPYPALATDIGGGTLPSYFFITPDTCHDGHDTTCAAGSPMPAGCAVSGGLIAADCWLQKSLPPLLQYLNTHNGVLFITTDEGSVSPPDVSGCCTGGPGGAAGAGGLVGLLALGQGVATGTTTSHPYDHVSLLRTTEDALGISTHLNNASTAAPMADLFAEPSTSTPEAPLVVVVPLLGALAAGAWWRGRRRR
jgi:hypothetical protein